MFEKAPMATYVVGQICFDPEVIRIFGLGERTERWRAAIARLEAA
jgi:hypothetical protein